MCITAGNWGAQLISNCAQIKDGQEVTSRFRYVQHTAETQPAQLVFHDDDDNDDDDDVNKHSIKKTCIKLEVLTRNKQDWRTA